MSPLPSASATPPSSPPPPTQPQPQPQPQPPPPPVSQAPTIAQAPPVQLPVDGAAVPPPAAIDADGDDDIFIDEFTEDMAEERTVVPVAFSGKPDEDGDVWLRHFLNYCRYKDYTDAKSLALIKVLLAGNAAVWLDSLPNATLTDFNALQQAFNERYKTPEIIKFRSAKEIFSRRQQPNESCDDYIAHMRKLARQISADDKMTRYAVLNGLLPHISSFVTQRQPENMDRLLEAARLAELTNVPKPPSETILSDQLADVQAEVKKLAQKWDSMTTAPVLDRFNQQVTDRRSP